MSNTPEVRISRRDFLKLMGVGACATVLSACSLNPNELPISSSNETSGNSKDLPQPEPSSTQQVDLEITPEEAKSSIIQEESQIEPLGLKWSSEPLHLDGEGDVPIQSWSFNSSEISNLVANGREVIVPVLPLTPQIVDTMRASAPLMQTAVESGAVNSWVWLFHWTKHAQQAGLSSYELTKYSQFLSEIVRGALDGQDMIIKVVGSEKYPDGYIFIRELSNGSRFMVKLSPDGSPITAFNTALKDGKISPQEAARYFSKLRLVGEEVKPNEVPAKIKELWREGPPPIWRFWWWALSYQASALGKTLVEYLNGLPRGITILVVPVYMFSCDNPANQMLPDCNQRQQ